MDSMHDMLNRMLDISFTPIGGPMWSEMKKTPYAHPSIGVDMAAFN